MQKKLCKHFIIHGRVQGVFFRACAQDEAKKLSLTGWTRNLPEGTVEILACGNEEELALFAEWLNHGPSGAKVDKVDTKQHDWQEFDRFYIKG